jgi:hypothetical protein
MQGRAAAGKPRAISAWEAACGSLWSPGFNRLPMTEACPIMLHFHRLRAAAAGLALGLCLLSIATPALAQRARPVAPPPVPVGASVVNPQPGNPAYGDLYDAMEASVDQDLMIEKTLEVVAREFATSDDFQIAEEASPGLIQEIIDGLRPILVAQSQRVRQLYRPATLSLLARNLTPDEATSIAAFYRSELGRRLMGAMVQNYSPDATLSNLESPAPITAAQVKEDLSKATSATITAMSQDDLVELGKLAMARPELLKLSLIGNGMQELRTQMENEPLTAEEDAAIVAVVEDVFARRFPKE